MFIAEGAMDAATLAIAFLSLQAEYNQLKDAGRQRHDVPQESCKVVGAVLAKARLFQQGSNLH